MGLPIKHDQTARHIWRNMKRASNPLQSGACHACQRNTETLFPLVMDICRACVEQFAPRGTQILKKKRYLRHAMDCTWCGRHMVPVAPVAVALYYVNIKLCERCMRAKDPSGRRLHKV